MPRFFRRLAEGVFDEDDVRRRADELADFVAEAREAYGLPAPMAVGFSNGANIAAPLLGARRLAGAALLRAMVPLPAIRRPRIWRASRILILSGAWTRSCRPRTRRVSRHRSQWPEDTRHQILPVGTRCPRPTSRSRRHGSSSSVARSAGRRHPDGGLHGTLRESGVLSASLRSRLPGADRAAIGGQDILAPPRPLGDRRDLRPERVRQAHRPWRLRRGAGGQGAPLAAVLGPLGAAVEFFGGLALALGAWTRLAAILVAGSTVTATLIAHRFWDVPAEQQAMQTDPVHEEPRDPRRALALVAAGERAVQPDRHFPPATLSILELS